MKHHNKLFLYARLGEETNYKDLPSKKPSSLVDSNYQLMSEESMLIKHNGQSEGKCK